MSTLDQYRFTVDTPHGRFGTNSSNSHVAFLFKSRRGSERPDVLWLRNREMADYQKKRMTRLGFQVLGIFDATEHVDDYLTRSRAK